MRSALQQTSGPEISRGKALTAAQLEEILRRMEPVVENPEALNRRRADRLPFRKARIPMLYLHPGGGAGVAGVGFRDLSATGASFVFSGFLHVDSQVKFLLPTCSGERELVDATVVWCRHAKGRHHLIGVRFAKSIVPKSFLNPQDSSGDPTLSK